MNGGCSYDWRQFGFDLSSGAVEMVLPYRKRRIAVHFTNNYLTNIYVGVNPSMVLIALGYHMDNNNPNLILTDQNCGGMIEAEWYAQSGGFPVLNIFEIWEVDTDETGNGTTE